MKSAAQKIQWFAALPYQRPDTVVYNEELGLLFICLQLCDLLSVSCHSDCWGFLVHLSNP